MPPRSRRPRRGNENMPVARLSVAVARMARNALIVLANTRDPDYLPLIHSAAQDVNPLIRATAVHALIKPGDIAMATRLREDPSLMVQHEANNALK
jgi:epoxyqueuosine reductase